MIRPIAVLSALSMLIGAACAPVQRPAAAPPVDRVFVFTPPTQATKLLPVTIALVRPSYAEGTRARMTTAPSWARETTEAFRSSMRSDLERLLVAKGFKVTGPFESLDMMTFPEKRGANLTLTPTVELTMDGRLTRQTPGMGGLVPNKDEGVLSVGGWVSLVMLEPLSGEKMWIKRVEVQPIQEPYTVTYTFLVRQGQRVQNILSDTRPNAYTIALNRVYPKVMEGAWTYFHPDEVVATKRQADEVRDRKRY